MVDLKPNVKVTASSSDLVKSTWFNITDFEQDETGKVFPKTGLLEHVGGSGVLTDLEAITAAKNWLINVDAYCVLKNATIAARAEADACDGLIKTLNNQLKDAEALAKEEADLQKEEADATQALAERLLGKRQNKDSELGGASQAQDDFDEDSSLEVAGKRGPDEAGLAKFGRSQSAAVMGRSRKQIEGGIDEFDPEDF